MRFDMSLVSSLEILSITKTQDAVPAHSRAVGTLSGREIRAEIEAAGIPPMLAIETVSDIIGSYSAHWEMLCHVGGNPSRIPVFFRRQVLASPRVTFYYDNEFDPQEQRIALNLSNTMIDWEDLQRIGASCARLSKIYLTQCPKLALQTPTKTVMESIVCDKEQLKRLAACFPTCYLEIYLDNEIGRASCRERV